MTTAVRGVCSARLRRLAGSALAVLAVLAASAPTFAQPEASPFEQVQWNVGPRRASIGPNLAEINFPAGYRFAGAEDTQRLLQAMQNTVSGEELGLIMPTDEAGDWFVVFEFSDVGYIKDDEKDKLDPDAMLEAIRQGTEQGNVERRKRGWPTMTIVGWEQPPHYDPTTNNLEWAIRGASEGHPVVNYNTRLLGRTGVMEANLVVEPDQLSETLPKFKSLLTGYEFKSGKRYAEFKPGDKIAKYGLAALVTGGAAAVALKTGLFQKLWKFIVVGVLAIGAAIKRIFGRRSSAER